MFIHAFDNYRSTLNNMNGLIKNHVNPNKSVNGREIDFYDLIASCRISQSLSLLVAVVVVERPGGGGREGHCNEKQLRTLFASQNPNPSPLAPPALPLYRQFFVTYFFCPPNFLKYVVHKTSFRALLRHVIIPGGFFSPL